MPGLEALVKEIVKIFPSTATSTFPLDVTGELTLSTLPDAITAIPPAPLVADVTTLFATPKF